MDRLALIIFAAVGGGAIAAQAPINARLRVAVGSPLLSAGISFLVGTVVLFGAVVATNAAGGIAHVGSAPWWAWLGGFAGAALVTATLMAAPKLGVTVTMVAVVAGQLVVGALVDRFGWLGVPARHLSAGRVTAILLIVVALVLLIRES